MRKPKHGSIFAMPLPDGTYLCGRVMLDIYACARRRLLPAGSPLTGVVGSAFLIEMYRQVVFKPEYTPSSVLLPGAFVYCSEELGSDWAIIAHQTVDPQSVEFPEGLIGHVTSIGKVAFRCGEMSIPLPLQYEEADRVDEHISVHSAFMLPFICLRMLGREQEVPSDYKIATLKGTDLRYSRHRKRIYKYLPFSMELSYFEKQAQLGLHLERLYSS